MSLIKFIFGKKSQVKFVEDFDFLEYLKRIGVFEEIVSGNRFCAACGTKITLENLQAIVPADSHKVRFICSKVVCLKQNDD